VEDFEKLNVCQCGKCILRGKVYEETLEYLNKTFPKKTTIEKLPFLHFRLFSPNLTLEQSLRAFNFDDDK
jgi:hypothetical protein